MIRKLAAAALFVLLVPHVVQGSSCGEVDSWTPMAPEGAYVFGIAVDAASPSLLIAATGAGAYRSTDGGASWQLANRGMDERFPMEIAGDPTRAGVAYIAGALGIHKTTDGGLTWRVVNEGLPFGQWVHSIAIDPTGATLWAGSYGDIFKSVDGGESWTLAFHTDSGAVYGIRFADATRGYAVVPGGGVLKTADGGTSWSIANSGIDDLSISSVAIDPVTGTLYAGGPGGKIFRSTDHAGTWSSVGLSTTGYPYLSAWDIAVGPASDVWIGTGAGVFHSADAGSTWTETMAGINPRPQINTLTLIPGSPSTIFAATNFDGILASTDDGASWSSASSGILGGGVEAMAIAPDGAVYGAVFGRGVIATEDGGASWVQKTTIYETFKTIAVDPTDPQTIYLGHWGGGTVWKSSNRGASWTSSPIGSAGFIYGIAVDPTRPSVVYASTDSDGVWKSTNGGTTWSQASSGLTAGNQHYALLIDTSNPDIVLLGASNGIYRSTDGGASWTHVLNGMSTSSIVSHAGELVATVGWQIQASPDGIDWAYRGMAGNGGTSDLASSGGTLFGAGGNRGVLKSADGGASWTAVGTGLGNLNVRAIEVDPLDPRRLWAATSNGGIQTMLQAASITGPARACSGAPVTLDAGAGWSTYAWSTGETTRAITITASADATYSVALTDANGCSATASHALTVAPATPTSLEPNVQLCPGSQTTLDAGPSFASYLWSTGATTRTITVAPSETTTYEVVATNYEGCATEATSTVQVSAAASAAITANGPTSFCEGKIVTLTASAATSYLWSTGATTQSIVVGDSGTYSVTTTDSSGCTATASQQVTVDPAPPVAISGAFSASCPGQAIELTASGGYGSFSWSTGESGPTITVSPSQTTTYSVTSALDGCSVTATHRIGVATPNEWIALAPESASVTSIAVTAAEPPVLLAATIGGVYRSVDAGASWNQSNEGFGADLRMHRIVADPVTPGIAYALAQSQVFKTTDGGSSWRRLTTGLPSFAQTSAIAVGASNPSVVLLSLYGDIYRSTDHGETWTRVFTGSAQIRSFAFSPASAAVFASASGSGVLRSIDGGVTWSLAYPSPTVAAVATDSGNGVFAISSSILVRSVDGGTSWSTVSAPSFSTFNPPHLTVDSAGALWLATYGSGVFYSSDSGASWITRSGGLPTQQVNEIRFLSANAGPTMFAATNFGGVFKSEDGAATWSKSGSGLIGGIVKDVGAAPDGTLWAATYASGALRSRDGGQTWTSVTNPSESYGSLAIDPSDPQTVYLGRYGQGTIHKTTDGGTTWSTLQPRIPSFSIVEAVAVNPHESAIVYAALKSDGVFKSIDGGASWSNVTPPGESGFLSLLIDHANPNVVYAGTYTGVFRSTDAGTTWSRVVPASWVEALARDAATGTLYAGSGPYVHVSSDGVTWSRLSAPGQVRGLRASANGLYAATDSGVHGSVDGGMSWSAVGALGNLDAWAVEVDPSNPSRFYVASNAGAGILAINRLDLAIAGPGSVCAGGSATLDAGPGFSSYLWSTGETTRSITVSPIASTSYSVAVTTPDGCSLSTSKSVSVNAVPLLTLADQTICAGSGALVDAGPGFSTYLWSDGFYGRTRFFAPPVSTTYTVIATTSAGCSTTGSVTIAVNPRPSGPIVSDGPTTFCAGGAVTLTAPAGASYFWSPTGQTTQSITVTTGGTYQVTVSNGTCSTTVSRLVTVNPAPPAPTITAADEGSAVRLTASAAASYLWSPGGATTQSILVTTPGSYTVTVGGSGCSVTSAPAIVAFAPTGDGVTAGTAEVTATFTSVTTGGSFTAVPTAVGSPLPAGYYHLGGTASAWELSTTAAYTGSITVGFHVPDVSDLAAFQALRILHGEMVLNPGTGVEELQLVDRTSDWDFANRMVFATVDSLSPFVLARVTIPTVRDVAAPAEAARAGTALAFSATFTDPDTASGLAATWEWGDGSSTPGTIAFDAARGVFTVSGSHAYAGGGLYTVRLVVSDGSGEGTGAAGPVIVYNPAGGWITGGANLASPAGALRGNATPAGARVSLTAKYDKQSGALKGNVEISVDGAARLRAETLAWLVVDGAAAVLHGRCSLEGSAECSYRITAIDGGKSGPDRARLQIWDGGATPLYDNARASGEAPAIESGSLTVHD